MNRLLPDHIRDIIILPFTVTCVVPYLLYEPREDVVNVTALSVLGFIAIAIGLALFAYTVILFDRIGRGTLAPWSPKENLVVQGPYRYCRNPMITGVLLILLGESAVFHSVPILVWSIIVFVINTLYFLFLEEPFLATTFGQEYEEYKRQVPRWLPRLRPYRPKE